MFMNNDIHDCPGYGIWLSTNSKTVDGKTYYSINNTVKENNIRNCQPGKYGLIMVDGGSVGNELINNQYNNAL